MNNNTRTLALGHLFRWERSLAHSGRELQEKQGTSRAYSDEATGTLTASLFGAALSIIGQMLRTITDEENARVAFAALAEAETEDSLGIPDEDASNE